MKFLKKLIVLIAPIFYCVILFSCNTNSVKQVSKLDDSNQRNDTIIKDIPLYLNQPAFNKVFHSFENGLGLTSLTDGVDGIEIRLWYTHDKTDTVQLLILKNANSNWSANLFTIVYKLNQSNDSVVSLKNSITKKEPKLNWVILIDSLFKLNIDILPDYTRLPEYKLNMGGNGVLVEFANSKSYRIYSYPEPEHHKVESPDVLKMTQILRLIEDHLQFKWL